MIEKIIKNSIGLKNFETIKDPLNNYDVVSQNYRGFVEVAMDQSSIDTKTFDKLDGICPTDAICIKNDDVERISIDNGKCIMCGKCAEIAPNLIKITNRFNGAKKSRQGLISSSLPQTSEQSYEELGKELKTKIAKIFGRSLTIRSIDAGSCNGCEIEITALNNPIYDIERFGIQFVASPRHADVLLVTGPASKNMEKALKIAYESTPNPKIVIAVGACACSGGIFGNNYATTGGIDSIVPVDVYIPGCPPRPQALIYGLLLAVNRI